MRIPRVERLRSIFYKYIPPVLRFGYIIQHTYFGKVPRLGKSVNHTPGVTT